jgi:hypothetical protein
MWQGSWCGGERPSPGIFDGLFEGAKVAGEPHQMKRAGQPSPPIPQRHATDLEVMPAPSAPTSITGLCSYAPADVAQAYAQ